MKYFEFGQERPELMVMLHGGGICCPGALPKPCGLEKRTELGKIDMEKRTKKSLKQL